MLVRRQCEQSKDRLPADLFTRASGASPIRETDADGESLTRIDLHEFNCLRLAIRFAACIEPLGQAFRSLAALDLTPIFMEYRAKMNRNRKFTRGCILWLRRGLLVTSAFVVSACASRTTIADRYEAFDDLVVASDLARSAETRIWRSFSEEFGGRFGDLHESGDEDLEYLFRSAVLVSYLTPEGLPYARAALEELATRGRAEPRHYLDLYDGLVRHRQFDAADALRAQRAAPEMEPLPRVVTAPGVRDDALTVLATTEDKDVLIRTAVSIGDGARIIAIWHPQCHFSLNAARSIASHHALAGMFKEHAVFIAPPRDKLRLDSITAWNRANPDYTVSIAYRSDDWPFIDIWETPTFVFMREGDVVEIVTGWPGDSRRGDLLRAAERIGIRQTAGPTSAIPLPK